MVVVPTETLVTFPDASIVATAALEELQVPSTSPFVVSACGSSLIQTELLPLIVPAFGAAVTITSLV